MTPNIKQTVLTDPLYAAIQLLTEEADSLRECHTRTPDDWAGEPEAKAAYDHILAVVAALSKLRAPVADETQAPHDHDLWFQEYGQTLGAFHNSLTIHTRAAWVAASRQYAALAGAPVAEPETMEEIHRRERERAPWVLPKDPTLPASAPDTSEADASPIVPGGPYSDPEQFIASLGASAPVAGYIKPDPAAPTHPRYVSELKYRSAADAEADPEGKGWLKVYAAPQASTKITPAHIERLISAYGYANRHPEDSDGIARAYQALTTAIHRYGARHAMVPIKFIEPGQP